MNYALIYVSKVVRPLSAEELEALSNESNLNNERLGLTGLLLYSGKNFMQILEGDYETLTELFAKITTDSRHHSIEVLMGAPASERLFPEWSMGVIDVRTSAQLDVEILNDICERAEQKYQNVKDAALETLKLFTFKEISDEDTQAA